MDSPLFFSMWGGVAEVGKEHLPLVVFSFSNQKQKIKRDAVVLPSSDAGASILEESYKRRDEVYGIFMDTAHGPRVYALIVLPKAGVAENIEKRLRDGTLTRADLLRDGVTYIL